MAVSGLRKPASLVYAFTTSTITIAVSQQAEPATTAASKVGKGPSTLR
jgi:hypothetical protein